MIHAVIPAHNEMERIAACITSLQSQTHNTGTLGIASVAVMSSSVTWALTILAVWTILMVFTALWRMRPVEEA